MTAVVRPPASPAAVSATVAAPAQVAKAALRRLALERLEPTPENYAQAYRAEAGDAAPSPLSAEAAAVLDRMVATLMPHMPEAIGMHSRDKLAELLLRSMRNARWDHAGRVLDTLLNADAMGSDAASLARLLERLLTGLERGTRQWTSARRKDSVQRVVDGSRNDARRLQQRLGALISSWETATGEPGADAQAADALLAPVPAPADAPPAPPEACAAAPVPDRDAWSTAFAALGGSLAGALAEDQAGAEAGTAAAMELRQLVASVAADGPRPHLDALIAL